MDQSKFRNQLVSGLQQPVVVASSSKFAAFVLKFDFNSSAENALFGLSLGIDVFGTPDDIVEVFLVEMSAGFYQAGIVFGSCFGVFLL